MDVEWKYCPECGSEDIRYEEGRHKQCKNCHQEWYSDIDYTDVVMGNLAKRFSQPSTAVAVPDGFQLVPTELTASQIEAAHNAYLMPGMLPASHYSPVEALRIEYAALLSAAPKPESVGG